MLLAARGRGLVEPNPVVGAVISRHGKVVAEGYHHHFGGPHAEVVALKKAGAKACGATLYVTLEPCCHWGKTPPCTDAILAAGISRVIVAMTDPYAKVHGKGIAILRRAGVRVEVGLMEKEARQINAPFVTQHTLGRPFIIAKWAQSLDGCIALSSGESKWISSEESRQRAQVLRGRVDAIVVGIRTALLDNPLLLARPNSGRQIKRIATRIVLDSACRLPLEGQLVRTVAVAPVLVAHAQRLSRQGLKRREELQKKGVMMVGLPRGKFGLNLAALLKHLQTLEYTNILVEGGSETLASFFNAELVDEAQVFVAPIVIGGHNARHAVGGPDLAKLAQAHQMELMSIDRCGPDAHLVLRTTP